MSVAPTSAWTSPRPFACAPSTAPLRRLKKASKAASRWVKRAVLVILAEDLNRGLVERLREVGVAMTVVGGEVVFDER
jgi:hypothetical protein